MREKINWGKTFVDVILGEAGDKSFNGYLSLVFARVQQERAHTRVFSEAKAQLQVIRVYVCTFQMLLRDLWWGTCWDRNCTDIEAIY